jgi:hypothetical protein
VTQQAKSDRDTSARRSAELNKRVAVIRGETAEVLSAHPSQQKRKKSLPCFPVEPGFGKRTCWWHHAKASSHRSSCRQPNALVWSLPRRSSAIACSRIQAMKRSSGMGAPCKPLIDSRLSKFLPTGCVYDFPTSCIVFHPRHPGFPSSWLSKQAESGSYRSSSQSSGRGMQMIHAEKTSALPGNIDDERGQVLSGPNILLREEVIPGDRLSVSPPGDFRCQRKAGASYAVCPANAVRESGLAP